MTIKEPAETQTLRADQKLWTRNFVLICLSALSVYLAFHSLLPTLPIYIQKRGGSEGTAGLALAFLTVTAVIIRPFTGWALDRYGRKKILALGLLVFAVPSVIYTNLIGIVPLLILRLIQGLGWGICNTSQGTLVSDVIPRSRLGEGLGFFGLTTAVSLATAPALGLWLADAFSFRILFATSSILTVVSLILAITIKYPEPDVLPASTKIVFMERRALRPSVIILLVTMTYSSVLSFLALFIRQQGMSTGWLFFTVMAVTTLISRPFSGALVDRRGHRGYDTAILTGLASVVGSMLVLAQTSGPWHLVFGGILFGIGIGFVQPTTMALCISSVPSSRRGAANATYMTAFDTGVAVGSVMWGAVANSFGYAAMYNLNVIPPLIALVVYLLNRKRAVN